jgi:hypothetical protein
MIALVQDIGSFVDLVTSVVYFYDRMAKDRPIASPVVYFLTEDLETRSLIEGAAGSRPYFMLKPGEEKEFVSLPASRAA